MLQQPTYILKSINDHSNLCYITKVLYGKGRGLIRFETFEKRFNWEVRYTIMVPWYLTSGPVQLIFYIYSDATFKLHDNYVSPLPPRGGMVDITQLRASCKTDPHTQAPI